MKRILTLFLSAGLALTASAQLQIQNGGFETWDDEGTTAIEPAHWNSFMSGTGKMKSMAAAQQVDKSSDAHSGNFSARIYARSIFGVVAQGNLTTGCINMGSTNATDANGNYNYTNEDDANFHQKFTGLPDAMRVWVKASCAYPAGASCNLHTAGYFQDPAGNTITAKRIAKANTSNIASSNDWQEVIVPFTYDITDGTRPAYALITVTTSGTPGQGNAADFMLVDDVEFLYYSELQSITFNGKEVAVTGTNVTIDGTYDEALLQLKSNGQGAAITTSYNAASKTLTVSIKGDDIASNPNNQHSYALTFTGKENDKPGPGPQPQPTVGDNYGSLVPFGDFEAWKNECGTTFQTGSGGGERQRPGIEPEGWNGGSLNLGVKLVATSDLKEVLVEKTTGINGKGTAVKVTNKTVSYWSNELTFPGFVTYGKVWAWSGPTNFMNSDEGVYGGRAYTKRPDAIRGQFKRSASTEKAHVIAYMWKGTFKSNIGAYDSPSTETDDVDRAVMGHKESTGNGQRIASCDYTFESTKNGDWETITIPLNYDIDDADPEKMNIILSSGDYWTRSIQEGNSLEADSIQFLFYSDLVSATYNGKAIEFDENNHAEMDVDYASRLLKLAANGRSATISSKYDTITRLLTITVKGGNIDENPDNFHTYTVQFPFHAELKSATYKGAAVTFDSEGKAIIDDDYDESQLQLTAHDASAIIEKHYDANLRILTITVKGADYATHPTNICTYTIEFLSQVKVVRERSYRDQIQVTVNDISGELQSATITLQEWSTGATSLVLKNFKMGSANAPMYIGTIVVNDITMEADGSFKKTCTTSILPGDDDDQVVPAGTEPQWLGPALGEVPLDIDGHELTGRDVPDSLHVEINIDLQERMMQTVKVLFGKSLIDNKGKGGDDSGTGRIQLSGTVSYTDDLTVTLNGNKTAPQQTTITVTYHDNNTLDLLLKNFGLKDGETDMPVGTINVQGVPYTIKDGVSYATFRKAVSVTIEDGDDPNIALWMGPMLGDIPITLAGKAAPEKLYCTIDINMVGVGVIHVDFGTDANWPPVPGGPTPVEDPILQDRSYADLLSVTVNGESSQPEEAQVHMTVNEEGAVTLTIKNFYLKTEDGNMPIGNIEVSDITPVEMPGKDYYLFETDQTVTIKNGDNADEVWIGPYIGDIPLSMSGKIARSKLYCNINIFMSQMKENVRVIFGESFTDGIEAVNSSPLTVNRDSIYNLAGQRLSKLQKGVNIVDGKKILVK